MTHQDHIGEEILRHHDQSPLGLPLKRLPSMIPTNNRMNAKIHTDVVCSSGLLLIRPVINRRKRLRQEEITEREESSENRKVA